MKLCDLHTHILPGVDDGAPNMECALQMLENAVASEVELLALTPHCNSIHGDGNYLDGELLQRFSQLQRSAEHLPLQLVLGCEARVNSQLNTHLSRGRIPTINGSRYLLTEFPTGTEADSFIPTLQSILEQGYTPIIAHPERYSAVCNAPEVVLPWLELGCHLQLTAGSILGSFGKTIQRSCAFLLKNDLVACIASDAHGVNLRSNFLLDVCDHLSVRYSKQYARCLLYENPMRICHNDDL